MLAVNDKDTALGLGTLLVEHKGENVVVMDLRGICGWTDFFVIATVTSSVHLQGLQRHIRDFCADHGVEIIRRHRRSAPDDEWQLVDLGNIVVHLMSTQARSFYELERLWSEADFLVRPEKNISTY